LTLHEPARHEPLCSAPWDEERARNAIARIVADTHDAFREDQLWAIHPFDVSPERPDSLKTLYYGAAGVIWALRHLEDERAVAVGADYRQVARDLVERHRNDLRSNELYGNYMASARPSFLMGEAGMLMLQWKLEPSAALADAIHAILHEMQGDCRGIAWGAPGSMLAARFMHERTGEGRWAKLFQDHMDALWQRLVWSDVARCWLWTEELYGITASRLGALHGFFANASAIVRSQQLVPRDLRARALDRICETLRATVRVSDGCANWPGVGPSNRPSPMPWLVQFCAGAPGVIACMSALSQEESRGIDTLLRQAGELVWSAGPSTKLPSLCHGTPAGGYALLKLHARTGDEVWLQRARAFAVHAIEQSDRALARYGQRKFSLWTGDLGLAVFLWDCIRAEPRIPLLDAF
jgi:hypothetical protein